jgi:hypothetical protein
MRELGKEPTKKELISAFEEFWPIYSKRPILNNEGGMGINHSFALWYIARHLNPQVVLESGVWRGHSTWLLEQSIPEAQIFSFDLNLAEIQYKSTRVHYEECDFINFDWSAVDTQNGLAFFDDHQNAYQRLQDARWMGFKNVILEDNYPVGEGDCYSLRHIFQHEGATSLQMSCGYEGSKRQSFRRKRLEKVLWGLGGGQRKLVRPNSSDAANLRRNVKFFFEFPPVYLEEKNMWGKEYTGNYSAPIPLFSSPPVNNVNWNYAYIAYVNLR